MKKVDVGSAFFVFNKIMIQYNKLKHLKGAVV